MSKDKKNKVTVKQTLAYDDAVNYLEDILKNFKAGKIILTNEDKSIMLSPSDEINFELKAGCKRGKTKLSMKFSWVEDLPEQGELCIGGDDSKSKKDNNRNKDKDIKPKQNTPKEDKAEIKPNHIADEKEK